MFIISIAWRFFTSKKSQTLLILLGFGIGIAVNVFIGSLIYSLEIDLLNETIGNQPHITISTNKTTDYIDQHLDILEELDNFEEVSNIAEIYEGRSFITNINPSSPDDIIVRGMNLDRGDKIYEFYDPASFEGSKPDNASEVIIGSNLAENLNVGIGDNLDIQVDPRSDAEIIPVTISGIFELGAEAIDSVWVLSEFDLTNDIFNVSDTVTKIEIQVNDVFKADTVANSIEENINSTGLVIANWKEKNQSLLDGLEAQAQSSQLIQFFVLLSVAVAIASVLSITVFQKSRQIGILKAMGLTDRRAALVFVSQGLLFGVFGSIIGLLLGLIMIYSFSNFVDLFEIYLDPTFIVLTMSIAVLSSILAAVIPARTSSNMEVIDIIREN